MNHTIFNRAWIAVSLLSLLVFITPEYYLLFGKIGWFALVALLFIRPLADILPKQNLFCKLMIMRKGLGILAGSFIMAHSVGYFLAHDLSLPASLIASQYWSLTNLFGWGMLGALVVIPLLLTSNRWSMKKLGTYWKPLQRLTYLLYLAGAIHIAYATNSIAPLVIFTCWFICWMLAEARRHHKPIFSVVLALLFIPTIAGSSFRIATSKMQQQDANTSTNEEAAATLEVIELPIIEENVTEPALLSVDPNCIGCGKCIRVAPSNFSWSNTERKAVVSSQKNLDSAAVERAIQICPVGAITL
jgi:DMSO/TMAO reductase YedYZ heme-binding membrane subunit/ferredoxin